MSAPLQRAILLRERGRHEEAVAFLTEHLAHQPEDPYAFIELALNRTEIPGQMKLALEDVRTASGMMPSDPFPLALQSRILNDLKQNKEALALAESAINLDPEFAYSWNSKALVLISDSRWKEAEACARTALTLDPDDETASNLLAHTLRLQNRLDESEEESGRRLARNPEDAFSFASAGWAALQRGDIKGAETKFKESLRIDPEMEYARAGLKESYRGRSSFYRLVLKWSFFLQRFSQKYQVAIIISLVIGYRVFRGIAEAIHPLLVIPVAFVYYLLVFGTWLANPLANFLLLKDPVARMSLDKSEKIEGAVVGLMFFGGIAALIAGFAIPAYPLGFFGGTLLATALPAALIFTNPSSKGRVLFSAITLAALSAGIVLTYDVATHPGREKLLDGTASSAFSALILLCVAASWLGMIPSLREKKPG